MRKALAIGFFSVVFLAFLTPMELGDVWWHLSSGRWIVEHRALPETDPFSVTAAPEYGMRFVLRGFWLAQILFYGAQAALGFPGLIALKAALFALTFYFTLKAMAQGAERGPLAFALLVPAVFVATYYDETRPQTISVLFFALALFILERARRGRGSAAPRTRAALALPPLMLVWANAHPGFVLGDALIGAYIIEEAVLAALGRRRPEPWLVLPALLAVAVSALNPNGIEAVANTLGMVKSASEGTSRIHEHSSLDAFAALTDQAGLRHALIGLAALGALSFLPTLGRPDVLRMALFAGLAAMAFQTFRAGAFFSLYAVVCIGGNLMTAAPGLRLPRLPRLPRLARLSAPMALALLAVTAALLAPRSILMAPVVRKTLIPYQVADVIELSAYPANLYHPYEWGGYLQWRLYPTYKTFIDGRAIGPLAEHLSVLGAAPTWRETLDRYGVNTVAYWPLLPYQGSVPPLVLALLDDPLGEFVPVSWDLQSIVFVRAPHAARTISKATVYELLGSLIQANIMADPGLARNYTALGEVLMRRGLATDARNSLARALALDPADGKAARLLASLPPPRPSH